MGLAGQKNRQKICDDPRNMQWVNDKSKFGYRMLEKMGWSDGKGLGLQESGVVEHVRVDKKEDMLGIGAKRKTRDNWLENTDAFSQLLASMNEQLDQETIITTSTLPTITCESENKPSPLHHRKKYIDAKREVFKDENKLNAVMGIKVSSSVVTSSDSKIIDTLSCSQFERISTISTTDYFKQKAITKEPSPQKQNDISSSEEKRRRKEEKRQRKLEKKQKKEKKEKKREKKKRKTESFDI